jgi:hypothetical protein
MPGRTRPSIARISTTSRQWRVLTFVWRHSDMWNERFNSCKSMHVELGRVNEIGHAAGRGRCPAGHRGKAWTGRRFERRWQAARGADEGRRPRALDGSLPRPRWGSSPPTVRDTQPAELIAHDADSRAPPGRRPQRLDSASSPLIPTPNGIQLRPTRLSRTVS